MYDREGTPTLRLLPENDFSRKEFVPVEEVYAYVEVKHNLILAPGGSFDKALAQVAAAKSLPRKDRKHTEIVLGFDLDLPMKLGGLVHPERANPMLGVIISAKLEMDERGVDTIKYSTGDPKVLLDLVIAGTDFVGIPGIEKENRATLKVFRDTADRLFVKKIPGRAFSIGLLALMDSPHFIDIGKVEWRHVFIEYLNAD